MLQEIILGTNLGTLGIKELLAWVQLDDMGNKTYYIELKEREHREDWSANLTCFKKLSLDLKHYLESGVRDKKPGLEPIFQAR